MFKMHNDEWTDICSRYLSIYYSCLGFTQQALRRNRKKKETALLACLEKQQVASAIFLLSDTFQHRQCKMKGTMRVRREKFTVVYFEFESYIFCVNFRVSG